MSIRKYFLVEMWVEPENIHYNVILPFNTEEQVHDHYKSKKRDDIRYKILKSFLKDYEISKKKPIQIHGRGKAKSLKVKT